VVTLVASRPIKLGLAILGSKAMLSSPALVAKRQEAAGIS